MLKHTIVCVMLVAAAAMAWAPLVDVPHKANVDVGTHLVGGDGLVWGVFPSKDSQSPTYVFSFDPEADTENGAYPWDTSIVAMSNWGAPDDMDTRIGECNMKPEVTFGYREEAAEDLHA